MPLLALWKSDPGAVARLSVEQVLKIAGPDGNLLDDSECSQELREYIASIGTDKLGDYSDHCLTSAFANSGRVLQDLVNEIGRRLDYDVSNGRYQGTRGKIGSDGVWKSPEGHTIIVEVKTTDAYRISLDTIAGYRKQLLSISEIINPSSILLIVGRGDTGELEAQVRGSRHAWDVRLISVDALLKLAKIKQETDDPETARKIRTLLVPFDNTRLDEIIEVMFSATKDISSAAEEVEDDAVDRVESKAPSDRRIDTEGIGKVRDRIIVAASKKMDVALLKKTRATYWDSSHDTRVACSISKAYPTTTIYRYWYAYHPKWDQFLADGRDSYMVWGCLGLDIAFMIPWNELRPLLKDMLTTEPESEDMYWHVKILERSPGEYALHLPLAPNNLSLSGYTISI